MAELKRDYLDDLVDKTRKAFKDGFGLRVRCFNIVEANEFRSRLTEEEREHVTVTWTSFGKEADSALLEKGWKAWVTENGIV